jgi:hypothetical protein
MSQRESRRMSRRDSDRTNGVSHGPPGPARTQVHLVVDQVQDVTVRSRCVPWRHDYSVQGVDHYEDVSFGRPGILETGILLACSRCGRVRTRHIDGIWTIAQVRGAARSGERFGLGS